MLHGLLGVVVTEVQPSALCHFSGPHVLTATGRQVCLANVARARRIRMRVMVQCIFSILLLRFHNMVSSVSRKTESGISEILVVRSMA